MTIKKTNSKEIIALSTFDAIRLRSEMYIGQKKPFEDKLPIISNGELKIEDKVWSPGFMHLIVEILENAIDEAKRMKGKMKNIHVSVNFDTNEIKIVDEGNGFYKAATKHSKTKKNVVQTAFEELHAGSNFDDNSADFNGILGTHGVGAAITNILSEKFEVITVNKTHYVKFLWKDFKVVDKEIRKREGEPLGTSVSFIPSKEVFPDFTWDKDLITTYLSFKDFLINLDTNINKLKVKGKFIKDGKESDIEVTRDFIKGDFIKVDTKMGSIYVWESFDKSTSLSFVNGSNCTGIQQKIVNDWLNEHFKYNLAHHFYETLIVLNVPANLMRFADQNKTKYAAGRFEIEEDMDSNFKSKLIKCLKQSAINEKIEQRIEERLHAENLIKIKRAKRQGRRKISEKYTPPSQRKDCIYISEGLSACGSIKQARDSESEGVYALKGKIKNTRKLSDLTQNKEILDIMGILDIEPESGKNPSFKKIIIATDQDFDGEHISALIINFFHRWFPEIIKNKRLYKLITPLVACDYKSKRHYFYTSDDFVKFAENKRLANVNYLKGLGSLSLEDWKYVMDNKVLFEIVPDRSSDRYLDIAFGVSAQKRKNWLSK